MKGFGRFFARANIALGAALFAASQGFAATIVVNTLDDELNQDGDCSLREAVQASNDNAAVDACAAGAPGTQEADIITFVDTLSGQTIVLNLFDTVDEDLNATGDLDILDANLIITGPGTTPDSIIIDGASDATPLGLASHRLIDVPIETTFFARLELQNLTLRNGGIDNPSRAIGGAVSINPGAPCTPLPVNAPEPCLALRSTLITGSTARSAGLATGGGVGGQFDIAGGVAGAVVIEDTEISDNQVQSDMAFTSGGGLGLTINVEAIDPVSFTLTRSNVLRNSVTSAGDARGGGLYLESNNLSAVSITGSEFSDNDLNGTLESGGGGAALQLSSPANYPITLQNAIFRRNLAGGQTQPVFGGGLSIEANNLGSIVITDSEFAENLASGDAETSGGGASLDLTSQQQYSLTLSRNAFLSNDASGSVTVFGGGLALSAFGLRSGNVTDSRFFSNTAFHDANNADGQAAGAGAFLSAALDTTVGVPFLHVRRSEFSDNLIPHNGPASGGTPRPSASAAGLSVGITDAITGNPGCPDAGSCVRLDNITISGNFIQIPNGDGFAAGLQLANSVEASTNHLTLFNNETDGATAVAGGLSLQTGARLTFANSITGANLANNVNIDCDRANGVLLSGGFNYITNNDSCNLTAAFGDRFGNSAAPLDPMLAPIAFIGAGTSRAHLPLPGSPLIDTANPGTPNPTTGNTCRTVDQNLVPRPQDGDGNGAASCDIGAVEVAEAAPNLPPEVVSPILDQTFAEGAQDFTIDLDTVFLDPEEGPLTYSVVSSDTGVALAQINGSLLTVTPGNPGTAIVDVTASDDQLQTVTDSFQFTVEAVVNNLPPIVVAPIPDQSLDAGGQPFSIDLNTVFEDPEAATLFFNVVSSNTGVASAQINGSILTVTPGNSGSAIVDITAFDELEQSATDSVQFTVLPVAVNQPPVVVAPIPDQTLVEGDQTFSVALSTVFEDPEQQGLSYQVVSSDPGVVIATIGGNLLSVSSVNPGSATVDVTAFDNQSLSVTDSVTFTVIPSTGNRPPEIISSIPDQILAVQGNSAAFDLNTIFSDPEGDELLFEASSSNTDVVTVQIDGSNLILIPGNPGTAVVTVTALDTAAQATSIRLKSLADSNVSGASSGASGSQARLGGSSGGGCTLQAGRSNGIDPMFALLALFAAAGLRRRRTAGQA